MIGYLKVVEKKTGRIISYYKYAAVNHGQRYVLKSNPEVALFCACNENRLEVKVSSDLRIYPAEQLTGHMHEVNCPRHIHFVSQKLWTIEKTSTNIYYHVGSHDATAQDFLERINIVTYKRLTTPENRMPNNHKDFLKKAFATTKYIKNANGLILYDIAVSQFRNIPEKPVIEELFIYGEVAGISMTKFSDTTCYVDILDSFEKRHRFYVAKEIIEGIIGLESLELKGKFIGGGFVFKKNSGSTILSFSDFYMAPINDVGIIKRFKGQKNAK